MSEPQYPEHESTGRGHENPGYEDRPRGTEEQMQSPPIDDQVNIVDLLIMLAKHKLMIIGFPLLVAVAVAGYSLTLPNVYTASSKILPPQQNQSSGAAALLSQLGGAGVAGALVTPKSTTDVYIAMLKSRTVADRLIERFDLMNLYNVKYPTHARERLAGAATIVAGRDGIITVDVTDIDPKRAADFANAYIDELMKLTQVLAVTEASQRRLFFERQLAQAKESLAKAEIDARRALAKGGVFKVDEQGRAMLETTVLLRGQITVKEVQIGAMRAFAADENPELQAAQRELASMRRELAKIEGDVDGGVVSPSKSNQGMDSVRLLRNVKYNEVVFELLAKQYEMAKISEAKDSSVIQVLDPAVVPDIKSGPKRLQMVQISLLVAVVLAVLAAFMREALQRARNNPQQISRMQVLKGHLWR
jgi:uncharacterized protein involved in exopolysaccharide biosynthesis